MSKLREEDIERWITVNGNHIPIKKGETEEEAVKRFTDYVNGASGPKDKEELKQQLHGIKEKMQELVSKHMQEDGTIDEPYLSQWLKMTKEKDEITYDLHSQLSPTVKDEKWKGEGVTALTRPEAEIARIDLLKDRKLFLAISEAQAGVSFTEGGKTADTAVDTLYKKNPKQVYSVFSNTREMLRKKYGDEITLYRAGTSQTVKTTQNMTSTKENAQRYAEVYGSTVSSVKVPVDDVLAVNITRTGGYEEFIVLNKKRGK